MIRRGQIVWADLPRPRGSEPGKRRPVLVVQSDAFNRSRIGTVLAAAVTSNLRLGEAPGNVVLEEADSGLDRRSVVNVSQVLTLDRRFLQKRAGTVPAHVMDAVDSGLRLVLGLDRTISAP